MSVTQANAGQTADSEPNTPRATRLGWDVFVTPGIPIVTRDAPPGVRETFFQAMASTLIYGARDAVLVDAFLTVKQATTLADWVATKGKNLTTIYITHGHGDHWFGTGTLLERFPNAKAVATPKRTLERKSRQFASGSASRGSVPRADAPGQLSAPCPRPVVEEATR